ncbi:MAG: hypothetical protein ABL962_02040 [Fimbriimonadaceae bacterium]
MKRYALLATAVGGAVVAFQGSVNLQATTPGTPQTGHLNITGTARAGSFEGYNNTPTGQTFGGDFRVTSNEGRAILGNASSTTGATYGGLFQNFSIAGRGVAGIAQASAGTTYGGFFSSLSNQGRGLYGQATSATGTTYGVYGKAVSPTGYGVYSEGNMAASGQILAPSLAIHSPALLGSGETIYARRDSENGSGIRSICTNPLGQAIAGTFSSAGEAGTGLAGYATGGVNSIAVYGAAGTGYAMYSDGRFHSAGNITTGGTISGNGSGLTNLNALNLTGRIDLALTGGFNSIIKATGSGTGAPVAQFITSSVTAEGVVIRNDSTVVNGATAALKVVMNGSGTGNQTLAASFENASPSGRAVSASAGSNGVGVLASGGISIWGRTTETSGTGVVGDAVAGSGVTFGVRGTANSPSGYSGHFTGPNADTVYVQNTGTGRGLQVNAPSDTAIWSYTTSGFAAVDGRTSNTAGQAIFGVNNGTTGNSHGVVGQTASGSGFGVFSFGMLGASGAKPFRIDHPLDPENKYLLHYSSESPTPQNFYSGNVKTGRDGKAWVELPEYFAEINTDFKYQLTVVDETESASFVMAKIGRKISNNRFHIMTSQPNVEVSWRVEATRNDLWMQRYGTRIEVDKTREERGFYQHPELYRQGPEKGINHKMEYSKSKAQLKEATSK